MAKVITEAVQAAQLKAEDAEEKALKMLWATPMLLWGKPQPKDADPEDRKCSWQQLRPILQKAERGDWDTLLNEFAIAQETRRRGPPGEGWLGDDLKQEEADEARWKKAAGKVKGRCMKTAAQIMRGSTVLPPTQETVEAVKELVVTKTSYVKEETQYRAAAPAWAAPGGRVYVTDKTMAYKVELLRQGAQPGPTKTSNIHIKSIAKARGGLEALAAWATLWGEGLVPPEVAWSSKAQYCDR